MNDKIPKPSDFMKARRPEQFSDSRSSSEPIILREVFDHHLATMTQRCEEKEFENFCRLIAQKEICPNLIIQTGSTGGGDSKVDTETYPVSDDVSLKWYEGIGRKAADERWAFAISVQKTWKPKVQGDIEKIALTGRDYKHIYFMSNQAIRDKERAETEDSLTKKYGIPVHILDKQWIIDKVYSNNRFDIAISALNLSYTENKHQVTGFNDAEKLSDLANIEKEIDNFDSTLNAGYQFVEDCLYAAVLSRELEKPKFEVYGRFNRAKNAAEEFGTSQQVLRAIYQHAWSAYWWYDDFKFINKLYDELETLSVNSDNVWDLERLCNLWINIQSAVIYKNLAFDDAKLDERFDTLVNALSLIADDNTRPNASTIAKSHILLLKLSDTVAHREPLSDIFSEIGELLNTTHNLIDVPVERLIKIIEELSEFIGEEDGFDELLKKIMDTSSKRMSSGEKGRLLTKNGFRKLKAGKQCEAIKVFGSALQYLTQYENRDDFIRTQAAIAHAYESMGLFWAARGCYAITVNQLYKDFAEDGSMSLLMSTLLRHLIWIEIRLGRVPYALTWLNHKTMLNSHILEIEEDEKSDDEHQQIDNVLGILILKTTYKDLGQLSCLPALLNEFCLGMSRIAALYALGYDDAVRFELGAKDDDLNDFFTKWLNQPANTELPITSEWNMANKISVSSLILGIKFSIELPNEKELLTFAEAILSAIECFLATGFSHKIYPKQSNFHCILKVDNSLDKISYKEVEDDCGEITMHILIPNDDILSLVQNTTNHVDIVKVVMRIVFDCVINFDLVNITALAEEDVALGRMNQLIQLPTVIDNILGSELRYSFKQWAVTSGEQFVLLRNKPWSNDLYHSNTIFESDDAKTVSKTILEAKHNEVHTTSIINVRIWNKAKWFGVLYGRGSQMTIPILGLVFENETEGFKIFNGWKKKLGDVDIESVINICIVTGIDKENPYHYKVVISPSFNLLGSEKSKLFMVTGRIHKMTPNNSDNLDNFKKSLSSGLGYFLVPAYSKNNQPKIADEKYWIKKNNIKIIEAWKIAENDMEVMAVSVDDNPIIPDGVANAPILAALQKKFHL